MCLFSGILLSGISGYHSLVKGPLLATKRTAMEPAKGLTMRIVQICMRCAEKSMELILEDVDRAEVEIEHLISHILLEFFEEILVDEVSITSYGEGTQEKGYLIFIRTRCTIKSASFQEHDDDFLALTLEGCVSYALAELLGEVDVEQVSINV
jgi:hypothetical protein